MNPNPWHLLLRSSLTCSLVIVPAVVLVYLSCASAEFQGWAMEIGRLAYSTLMRSSELPTWIHFTLAGFVYWAQCVISKLIKHRSCSSIVIGLMCFQGVVLISLLVMAPGVLSDMEDKSNPGLLYLVHFIVTLLLTGHNADRYIETRDSAKE